MIIFSVAIKDKDNSLFSFVLDIYLNCLRIYIARGYYIIIENYNTRIEIKETRINDIYI